MKELVEIAIVGRYITSKKIDCYDCKDINCWKKAVRDLSIRSSSLLSRNKGIDDDYAVGFRMLFSADLMTTDEEDEEGDLRYPYVKPGIYKSDLTLPQVFDRGIIKAHKPHYADDSVYIEVYIPIVWD